MLYVNIYFLIYFVGMHTTHVSDHKLVEITIHHNSDVSMIYCVDCMSLSISLTIVIVFR